MRSSRTIKHKALFLLVTFSLNSVVGFACSLGIDMGFNSHHHSHESGKQHEHSDADHHEHDGANSHSQHGANSRHHTDNHSNTASFTSPSEDNCCKDFVVGFQSMDKMVAKGCSSVQQQHIAISPFVIPVTSGLNNTKGFTKNKRIPPTGIDLPPPDILIFIQSFRI